MRKTAVLEILDTLVVSFRVVQGSRKTVVLEISDTLVVRFSDRLGSAQDLAAAVATSDPILWSCRAQSRRHRLIMVCRRWGSIRSGAFCIDT